MPRRSASFRERVVELTKIETARNATIESMTSQIKAADELIAQGHKDLAQAMATVKKLGDELSVVKGALSDNQKKYVEKVAELGAIREQISKAAALASAPAVVPKPAAPAPAQGADQATVQ